MKQFFIFIVCYSLVVTNSLAQSGTLDKSFGTDGKVITEGFNDNCTDIALQRNGKIILAGSGALDGTTVFQLIRYNADGSIDLSFGESGRVLKNYDTTKFATEKFAAVAMQDDDKIIAAGWAGISTDTGRDINIALAKVKPDGSFDSSFGINGFVIGKSFERYDYITGLAIQPDGKIVVTGNATDGINRHAYFTMRYLPDGSLDASFGNEGIVFSYTRLSVENSRVVLQPDGKIITSARYFLSGSFLLIRYLSDGTLDSDFGENGYGETNGIYFTSGDNIALQADGKILLVGSLGGSMMILRVKSDGIIDSTFGANGLATANFGETITYARKVLVQADKKILTAGSVYASDYTDGDFAIARFNENGQLDSGFASNGMQIEDMGGFDDGNTAALQEDGNLMVAGNTYDQSIAATRFALARFHSDMQQEMIARIKKWLHRHGFTWDDWPGNNKINYYSVQRSSNGSAFTEIARLFRHNRQQQYSYEDVAPLAGSNYYRLAAVSTDGNILYSNIIAIENNTATKIYPNPVKNNLQVEGLSSTQKTKLTITDLNGNTSMKTMVTGSTYSWNVSQLKHGHYILKIESGNQTVTRKFIKE